MRPVEHIRLPRILRRLAGVELGHHLAREQVQAVADRLVAGTSGLVEQDDLIDMRVLELAQPLADGFGRTDQAVAQRLLRLVGLPPLLVLTPQIAVPGASIPFRP